MKFTTVFAVLTTLIATASASADLGMLTNAQRFARGLPPATPAMFARGTPTYGGKTSTYGGDHTHDAHKSKPSGGIHNSCNTGSLNCCNEVGNISKPAIKKAFEKAEKEHGKGLGVDPHVVYGASCSPLTFVGLSHNACTAQAVCCDNNEFNGVVALGCSPINVNLV